MKATDFHEYMTLQRCEILSEQNRLGFWLYHGRAHKDHQELAEFWIFLNAADFAEHYHEKHGGKD